MCQPTPESVPQRAHCGRASLLSSECNAPRVGQVDFKFLRLGPDGSAMREHSRTLPQRTASAEQISGRRRAFPAAAHTAGAVAIGFFLALSLLHTSDSSECEISNLLRPSSWRGDYAALSSIVGGGSDSGSGSCHLQHRGAFWLDYVHGTGDQDRPYYLLCLHSQWLQRPNATLRPCTACHHCPSAGSAAFASGVRHESVFLRLPRPRIIASRSAVTGVHLDAPHPQQPAVSVRNPAGKVADTPAGIDARRMDDLVRHLPGAYTPSLCLCLQPS